MTAPDPLDGLREQAAEAIARLLGVDDYEMQEALSVVDEVLAVVRPVVDALTAERAIHADQATRAADALIQSQAEVAALRKQIDQVNALLEPTYTRDQISGQRSEHRRFHIRASDLRAALGVTDA